MDWIGMRWLKECAFGKGHSTPSQQQIGLLPKGASTPNGGEAGEAPEKYRPWHSQAMKKKREEDGLDPRAGPAGGRTWPKGSSAPPRSTTRCSVSPPHQRQPMLGPSSKGTNREKGQHPQGARTPVHHRHQGCKWASSLPVTRCIAARKCSRTCPPWMKSRMTMSPPLSSRPGNGDDSRIAPG